MVKSVQKVYLHLIVGDGVEKLLFQMALAAILDILVKTKFLRQTDVRIGFPMVDSVQKVYLHLIVGALVQKLIFPDGAGGHFGFGPLAKNAGKFSRDRVSKFFLKGP